MRMDKYNDEIVEDEILEEKQEEKNEFSRTEKNDRIYRETYLNSSVIDIRNGVTDIFGEEEKPEVIEEEIPKEIYIKKNYDIDDYIEKAHENKENDNLMRSLVDTDYDVNKVKEKKDEISKLIEKIEEKEQKEDFFYDLMPDDSDTVITDPVESDTLDTPIDETRLDTLIGDDTFISYAKEQEEKKQEEESFKDIIEPKHKLPKKLPLIIFGVTLAILVIVIIILLVK
jgi:hypothetical protein